MPEQQYNPETLAAQSAAAPQQPIPAQSPSPEQHTVGEAPPHPASAPADAEAPAVTSDDIEHLELEDRRPSQWKKTPFPVRLVGTKIIDGHVTFTALHTGNGGSSLRRWWMPSATEAMNHVNGAFLIEMVETNPSSAEMLLALEALRHSGIDDETLEALMSLPAKSTAEVLGEWTAAADADGTSAGELRGSAAS